MEVSAALNGLAGGGGGGGGQPPPPPVGIVSIAHLSNSKPLGWSYIVLKQFFYTKTWNGVYVRGPKKINFK